MNFRPRTTSEPEINLIAFIDVLLVILIFLMLTTTYNKFNELQLNLPVANAEQAQTRPNEIRVSVSADGQYAVNGSLVGKIPPQALAEQLRDSSNGNADALLVIQADAMAAHQSVISVMEAARSIGLAKITFATQSIDSN